MIARAPEWFVVNVDGKPEMAIDMSRVVFARWAPNSRGQGRVLEVRLEGTADVPTLSGEAGEAFLKALLAQYSDGKPARHQAAGNTPA